jgi:glycylpeptide N-tetradecanoyltransferase
MTGKDDGDAAKLREAAFGRDRGSVDDEENKAHAFWDTQPVPKMNAPDPGSDDVSGPIDVEKTVEEVSATPLPIPAAYKWDDIDLLDDAQVDEVYNLLYLNYVEDNDAMFRFDYSREFLKWALLPPEYKKVWHAGVRVAANGKLVAFISAIPATMQVYDKRVTMVEINYLCVHKKLRNKRLAPVLIKEITRRVNRENIWQAAYTAGALLPSPVARNRYWRRSINPKKLIEVGFSSLHGKMTMKRTMRLYALPDEPVTPGMRELRAEDVPQTHALLANYLKGFKLYPHMTEEEFAHWFIPRKDVVYTYVVEVRALQTRSLVC